MYEQGARSIKIVKGCNGWAVESEPPMAGMMQMSRSAELMVFCYDDVDELISLIRRKLEEY